MEFGRKQEGITMVTLVVTVVILLIISGIGVNFGIDAIKKSKDSKLASELIVVQHAILEQYTKYQTTKDVTYLVGNKMNQEEMNLIASNFGITLASIPNTYPNKDYYKLDKASLLEIGISDSDDEYIVNYISGEVINITKTTSDNKPLYIRANSFYQ